jgi:hypothetical protein
MSFTREAAVEAAKKDLAGRLNLKKDDIEAVSVDEVEFPDMSLGAAASGEVAAQMLSSGWRIKLQADERNYEYRADKYQLRLHNFKGKNYVIAS